MSTTKAGVVPTRQRGHERVAAILDAAAAVFAEKGFDAATMTEIAAAARTAIGSLYRFFPTKDLLADAVFGRYAEGMLDALDALAQQAPAPTPDEVAGALVSLMLGQPADRDVASALLDAREDGAAMRARFRSAIRERIALVLQGTGVPAGRAALMAPVVLQAMKALPVLLRDGLDRDATAAEVRRMIRCYVAG
jgi:AcrR family transcriptional regulator